MHQLIKELFQSQEFERNHQTELELYRSCVPDKTSYWLVIHDKPDLSPEYQAKCLSDCKKAALDSAMEKNINLLIAWETDSLNVRSSKLVHHAEEDSYFFKKHVLPYTTDEFKALQQQIEQNGLKSLFNNVLIDTQTFTEYKAQHNKGGWQSLLYRLVIKIPTLKIQGPSQTNLANLEQNIRDKISSSKNNEILLKTQLALFSILDSQDPSSEITPEILFSSMSIQLKEAGYDLDN